MQWCLAVGLLALEVRALLDQDAQAVDSVPHGAPMSRRDAQRVLAVDVSTTRYQQLHDLDVVVLDREMQREEAHGIGRLLGTAFE